MGRVRWAQSEDEDEIGRRGGLAWGQVGGRSEDRKRARGGPPGRGLSTSLPAPGPVPGEGRGLRLVQPGGRKEGEERQRLAGRAAGAAGGALGRRVLPPGTARRSLPPRVGPGARARPPAELRVCAERLCSVLQVYPEPRSESECLSNIREFLRGCGASLRLEVSGGARGPRGPARGPPGRGRGPRAGRSRRTELRSWPSVQ